MKHALFVLFLLGGCASYEPPPAPRNMQEAYVSARGYYKTAIAQMVEFKDECGARPPVLRDECWPTVERMRRIAEDGMKYRQALDAAYIAGNESDFDASVTGMKVMQAALIREIERASVEQAK